MVQGKTNKQWKSKRREPSGIRAETSCVSVCPSVHWRTQSARGGWKKKKCRRKRQRRVGNVVGEGVKSQLIVCRSKSAPLRLPSWNINHLSLGRFPFGWHHQTQLSQIMKMRLQSSPQVRFFHPPPPLTNQHVHIWDVTVAATWR